MKQPKRRQEPLTEAQMSKLLFGRLCRWKEDDDAIDFVAIFESVMEHGPNRALKDHIEAIAAFALAQDGSFLNADHQQADEQTVDPFGRRWIWRLSHTGDTTKALQEAIQKKRWRLATMLAGVMSLGDTIRAAQGGFAEKKVAEKPSKTAPAPKAKAVTKTAKKKPAAKKPERPRKSQGYSWKPSLPAAPGKVATLKDLVAQAKPLFEKNPKLDRQGLINKIGRRYERLTTFDELRTLCAGKTVTTHSVKKDTGRPVKPHRSGDGQVVPPFPLPLPSGEMPSHPPAGNPAAQWPWPTEDHAPKAKRPRRDPAKPVVLPESSIPKGVRTKPWPLPIPGTKLYHEELAEHAAEFEAGEVSARFTALETESGWTHGCRIDVADKRIYSKQLREGGPLAQDADTAIRDCTAGALHELKGWLKESEPPTEAARDLVPYVGDMLKLRSWLLGFQARGVEKIAFLKKGGGQMELAA